MTSYAEHELTAQDRAQFETRVSALFAGQLSVANFIRMQPLQLRGKVEARVQDFPAPLPRMIAALLISEIDSIAYRPSTPAQIQDIPRLYQLPKETIIQLTPDDYATSLAYYRKLNTIYHHGYDWLPTIANIGSQQ